MKSVDGRADLYATGAVLFECVTGRPVFEAPSLVALLARHLEDTAPDPRQLNTDVPETLARGDPPGTRPASPRTAGQTAGANSLHALEQV